MRMIAKCLVTTSLVLVAASAAAPVQAAELNTTSAVDAVTVYPDGASVTRIIAVDLPAGDNTLVARDFPLGLDASSLRGEGGAADVVIREAERKQRDIDREIARLEQERAAKPPSKLEVRIDLAATAPAHATLKVTYAVRHARWTPLYDARLDTGTKDRKPALE